MLPRLLAPGASADVIAAVKALIQRANPEAAIHALEAMRARADASAALPNLQRPVMVIAGEHDIITRVVESRAMAEAASGEFIVIPGAGHLSNLENPAAFNQALGAFVRNCV
jgi:3-oxoadipate enol-lactonase